MERFVYHVVPADMQGDVLYPLSVIKSKFPHLAQKFAEKYSWRQDIMKRELPILNRFWNEVIHLSTIDPRKTMHELSKLRGVLGKTIQCVAIPIENLNSAKCLYFMPSAKDRDNLSIIYPEEVSIFDVGTYRETLEVPADQIKIWKKNISNNEPALVFSRTLHLL